MLACARNIKSIAGTEFKVGDTDVEGMVADQFMRFLEALSGCNPEARAQQGRLKRPTNEALIIYDKNPGRGKALVRAGLRGCVNVHDGIRCCSGYL